MAADVLSETPIVRFLRSGRLPFLARRDEIARISAFLNAEAHQLRIALVLAEAGLGKSRFVEEALPPLIDPGTVLLHLKLYPEGTTAIPPLMVDALEENSATQALLRQTPERSVAGVADALRRITRLRPTILVLEDLHLLAEESLREFSRLLEALADESLSVICLARPQEFRAHGVVERWTVETVELHPLDRDDLMQMWQTLFGGKVSDEALEALQGATRGNILALRSVIRALLGAKAMVDDGGGRWHLRVSLSDMRKIVRHAVELVVEGMVAHIDLHLINRAEMLATLGEVFSTATARLLMPDADSTIEALHHAGVLTTPTVMPRSVLSSTPGEKESDDTTHSFSHSLLHQYLVDHRQVEPDQLLAIIAARGTLYSFLPITLLHDHVGELRAEPETVREAYVALRDLTYQVDASTDWPLAPGIVNLIIALTERRADAWDEKGRDRVAVEILRLRSGIERRTYNDQSMALLSQFVEATTNPVDLDTALFRANALSTLLSRTRARQINKDQFLATCSEILDLSTQFPALRNDQIYAHALHAMAITGVQTGHITQFEAATRILRSITTDLSVDERTRSAALIMLADAIIWSVESEEEVEDRLAILAQARTTADALGSGAGLSSYGMSELLFLAQTGNYRELLELSDAAIEQFRARGLWQSSFYAQLNRQLALASQGVDLALIGRRILDIVRAVPKDSVPSHRSYGAQWPIQIGLLANNTAWARAMMEEILEPEDAVGEFAHLALESTEGNLESLRERLTVNASDLVEEVHLVLYHLLVDPIDPEQLKSDILHILQSPRVRLVRFIDLMMVIHLIINLREERKELYESLHPDICECLRGWLAWMEERGMNAFMQGTLDQFAGVLPTKEETALRARITAVKTKNIPTDGGHDSIRITMLGSIRVALPGEDLQPLKGVRIRTLLGLMIADRMLKQPLTSREFLSIAASDEMEYELARKKRNMGVVRLREALGPDAVLTDGETPQLNLSRLRIDLLDAHQQLETARTALRERSLARAAAAVLELLEITRGEVAFPALYEEFFEAARDEFELRVRQTVISTVEALEREEDLERAEEILRRVVALVPDDEEMIERLTTLLQKSNRPLEAARLRLRATLEEAD